MRRIPSALGNYFGLTARSFTRRPPFFQVARVRYGNNALFVGWKEETLSLSLGSSWLVLGPFGGFIALLQRPRSALAIVLVILFGLQALLISTYYFVTQRFSAEFLPLLMFLLFVALLRLAAAPCRSTHLLWWLLPILALGSAVVTVASALQWNLAINDDVPREYKIRLSRLLDREGSVPRCRGRVVRLAALTPIAEQKSFAPMRKDTTWDGAPLVMDGLLYSSALGMHADASATFVVPNGAVAFCAVVGLPDKSVGCAGGSVIFELRGQDGRLLYRSRTIRSGEGPESVFADLRGIDHLTLAVTDAGDGITCDHGSWGLPVFLLEPSAVSSK
jgi:hypothetical protein